uniref:Ribosomal protein L5 n=1 Tax=Palpitomonas bilix TaxID=652834 RepID=A0A1E1GHS8_9EUKA|nr:ribosomal protein L5 [Palpitomonas bilix]BAV82415.1 ribosomal protein L5 [Palpitomonas bilix]
MNRLLFYYENVVRSNMLLKIPYKNNMQIIKPKQITLNISCKDAVHNLKYMYSPYLQLELITGQRPCLTYAKKSIATFKLRQGMKIGAKVTLRGSNLYSFLHNLIHIALPRDRDFSGLTVKNISNKSNISFGLNTLLYFLEIENQYETFDFASPTRKNQFYGMDVSINFNTLNNVEIYLLLNALNVPFKDKLKKYK